MNQSHPRAAARSFGGWRVAGAEAVEDAGGGRVADVVDERLHLGHAADALHQLAVGRLVLLDPGEEGVEAAGQRLERRQVRIRLGPARDLLGALLKRRDEEVLLAREVVVEQRLGDAGLARDASHRELAVRVRREQLGAQVEQLAAALVDLHAGVGGSSHRGGAYAASAGHRRRIVCNGKGRRGSGRKGLACIARTPLPRSSR